jgi:hypothetical protein
MFVLDGIRMHPTASKGTLFTRAAVEVRRGRDAGPDISQLKRPAWDYKKPKESGPMQLRNAYPPV